MIIRHALADLVRWYSHQNRKPLILRGARQVGKSTLVREFATQTGVQLWEINCEKHRSLDGIFGTFNIGLILQELSLTINQPMVGQGKGILFLDEIQECPQALACLRYFREELPTLAVIAAGSLLEFTLSDTEFSMPVGRVDYYWLDPLSFDEYLAGVGEHLALQIWNNWSPGKTLPEAAHQRLLFRFREYLIVGGMPEAVQVYIDTSDFLSSTEVHRSILETYHDDFSKYARGAALEKIRRVYDFIPKVAGRKIQFRQFHPDWKAQDIRYCLELLLRAGLALQVVHTGGHGLPLGVGEDPSVWKIYFLDVGLAGTANGTGLLNLEEFREGRFLNEGTIAEQFVAQNLAAHQPRSQRSTLHYWLREGKTNNAEVDFLVAQRTAVLPVEVKSGTAGSLRSLHQFMVTHGLSRACRLDLNLPSIQEVSTETMTTEGRKQTRYRLFNMPVYLAGRLCKLDLDTGNVPSGD